MIPLFHHAFVTHSNKTCRKCWKIIFQICWSWKCWNSELKNDITCHIQSNLQPQKVNISLENSFVFYWLLICLLAYISKSILAIYGGFWWSGSHLYSEKELYLYYVLIWHLHMWQSILSISESIGGRMFVILLIQKQVNCKYLCPTK